MPQIDGMYHIAYSLDGDGFAALTFQSGMIFGFDPMGGLYDGTYSITNNGDLFVAIRVKIPAHVQCVIGGISKPHDWELKGKLLLSADLDCQSVLMATDVGPFLQVSVTRMRSLPSAA